MVSHCKLCGKEFEKKPHSNKIYCHTSCTRKAFTQGLTKKTSKKCSVKGCKNFIGKNSYFLCDYHFQVGDNDEVGQKYILHKGKME
jgi:hypothetical protein